MAKDPAALIYIANLLEETAEMDSDVRGWYMNLLLRSFHHDGLPDDTETLASLAGVKFSEYERFKHSLEHVLKQKLERCSSTGKVFVTSERHVIDYRKNVKTDGQTRAANIGVVIKKAKNQCGCTSDQLNFLKEKLLTASNEEIEQAKDEHLLKQMLKLYNTSTSININNKDLEKGGVGENKNSQEKQEKDFLLIPQMQEVWMQVKPSYPKEKSKDFPALQNLAKFLFEKEKLPYNPRDSELGAKILKIWERIAIRIAEHSFFKNYSLSQVYKHIQSIIQDLENENRKTNFSKNTISTAAEQRQQQRDQAELLASAHAKFFSHESE